jgi:hypothetical protein
MVGEVIDWYPKRNKNKNRFSKASIFYSLISDKTRSVEDDCRSR